MPFPAVLCVILLAPVRLGTGVSRVQIATAQEKTRQPTGPSAAPPQSSKIDPAKEADIRRLLDIAGTGALATQMMDSMTQSIRPLMIQALPPGDYRDKLIGFFFEKFRVKADVQQLIALAVPSYDKYFSHEEIKDLIQFYQTPLGQKALTTLPKLMGELQSQGKAWGEQLGGECMREVLAEHPELAQALQAAAQASAPH
jgi:uncharacterized protein